MTGLLWSIENCERFTKLFQGRESGLRLPELEMEFLSAAGVQMSVNRRKHRLLDAGSWLHKTRLNANLF
jgi:hypothetical protein